MGGKIWSDREERYFWRTAMTYSAKRVGTDRAREEKSWVELALNMQAALKEHARRHYTGTMLFEHYFQNIESQRVSPNAGRFVREYLRKLGPDHGHSFLRTAGTKDATEPANDNNNSLENREEGYNPLKVAGDASQSSTPPTLTSSSAPSATAPSIPASSVLLSATSANGSSSGQMLTMDYLESHHDETNSI